MAKIRVKINLTPEERTTVLVTLVNRKMLPVRARIYNDDIVKSHCRGAIYDPNIQAVILELGYIKGQQV